MRKSACSRFDSLIGPLSICFCAALLLASCSKTPREQILGKWNVEESHTLVDYRKDGTFVTTANGKSTTNHYRFIDGDHLQMEINLRAGTNATVVHLNCQIAFRGDHAELTATIPGSGAGISQTLHYTRAK